MTIMQYIVARACERYGHNGNQFCTANFQTEFSKVTDSEPMVTPAQAEAILQSTPGVVKTDLAMWRFNQFASGE